MFYFLKDGILISGLLLLGVGREEYRAAARLYRGFAPFLIAAFAWTVLEIANPEQHSALVGLLGLRAYWLWWIAPVVIASALHEETDEGFVIGAFSLLALVVAGMAVVQFQSPADSAVNRYAWGTETMGVAVVEATGRARVSSTFAYLTGFTDFVTVVSVLLLGLAIDARRSRARLASLMGAGALAGALPMSGARGPASMLGLSALVVFWSAGAFQTTRGRRVAVAAGLVALIGFTAFPEAVQGVQSRFEYSDTRGRYQDLLQLLPPFALAQIDHPSMGIGTGMLQSFATVLGVRSEWGFDGEVGRQLMELGAVGYLVMWAARLGLSVALLRLGQALRRGGHGATGGAAWAFAGLAMLGNNAFDHVWQALLFVVAGILLQMEIRTRRDANSRSGEPSWRSYAA